MFVQKKEKNMQIGAINGTSFKGLLICKPLTGLNSNRVAINTDNINYIAEGKRSEANTVTIACENDKTIKIEKPFDIVVNAYKAVSKTPDSKIDLTSKAIDI